MEIFLRDVPFNFKMPVGKIEEKNDKGLKINGVEYEITENAKKFADRMKVGDLVFFREKEGTIFFIKKLQKRGFRRY